jgi:hypothetical protein
MKLLLLPAFLIISVSIFAQIQVRDVIYLNNGSIIRGNIIEISDNKTLKIESCDNVLVFDMAEVQKVTKEEIPFVQVAENISKPDGYINITSFGVLSGNNESSMTAPAQFSFETVNAYRLNRKYSFGLGIGIDRFDKLHVPVFLDCRYQLLNRDISPVIILKGGYSLPVGGENNSNYYYAENYSKGGPMLGAGAGLIFRINNHNLAAISLAYRYQQTVTTEVQRNNDMKWTYDHSVKYNRLEIKFGFYFD